MDDFSNPLLFDPFAMPYGYPDQTLVADYASTPYFSPGQQFGVGDPDFSSNSVNSPLSPDSAEFSVNSYVIPSPEDWTPGWEMVDDSFQREQGEGNFDCSVKVPRSPMTPAVNPMELIIRPASVDSLAPRHIQIATAAQQPSRPSVKVAIPPLSMAPAVSALGEDGWDDSLARGRSLRIQKKRKTSGSPQGEGGRSSKSPRNDSNDELPKKIAHNEIEKRYRTNLNDKIIELRDAVPALRVARRRLGHTPNDEVDLADAEFGPRACVARLNKATILSQATEYINQLECRNKNLKAENTSLRGRMENLEMLLMARRGSAGIWS